MLTTEEIKKFMLNDQNSIKKDFAKVGQRYYEAEHDIKKCRVFFINADGKLQEDKIKSNIKMSHAFFTELVDECTQYLLSNKEGYFKSDDPSLQTYLDDYFNNNEDFNAELNEMINGVQIKGFDYMYAYKNAKGFTNFQNADSLGVIEVKAKEASDKEDHIIYSYVEQLDKDNKLIKKIQVWDKKQTYYYEQIDEGAIKLDPDAEINPKPHTIYKKDGSEQIYFENYGKIPFFRIDNNKKQQSSLKTVKEIIDDYDLNNCGLSNNIQDANEVLYVVKGFQGDNLDELMFNIKNKKHIGVDSDGDIDIKTIDIPVEARKTKMEIDEKNIFRFGMGLDISALKDTNATTNMAIKLAYALLDLRANKLEIKLRQFFRKILELVLKEINEANGTDYQQKDVYFDLSRNVIANAQENAQIKLTEAQAQQTAINTLLSLAVYFDNEDLMKLICDELDIDYEEIKDRLPNPDEDPTEDTIKLLNKVKTEDIEVE